MTKRKGDSAEEARSRERLYRAKNRQKRREQSRAHYDKKRDALLVQNLKKMRARRERLGPMGRRELHLHHRYGILVEDYNAMLAAQGGLCAICGLPPRGGGGSDDKLHVDHDHTTGRCRALLCGGCNRGLGKFRDSAALCRKAADYLDAHGASEIQRGSKTPSVRPINTKDKTGALFQ